VPRVPGLRVTPAGSGGIVGRQDRRTAGPSAEPTRSGSRAGLLPVFGAAELHMADLIRHQTLPSRHSVGGTGSLSRGRPRPITDRRGGLAPLASLVLGGCKSEGEASPQLLDPRPVGHICPAGNAFDGGQRIGLGGSPRQGRKSRFTTPSPPRGTEVVRSVSLGIPPNSRCRTIMSPCQALVPEERRGLGFTAN